MSGGRVIRTSGLNGRTRHGDTGGPLFKLVDGRRPQVGVVSGGEPGCPEDSGFLFASTPTSLTRIQNVMADFRPPAAGPPDHRTQEGWLP